MSIFGTALDASTGRWIAFNEETLTSLSDHDTEADALEACRRYLEREVQRAKRLHAGGQGVDLQPLHMDLTASPVVWDPDALVCLSP